MKYNSFRIRFALNSFKSDCVIRIRFAFDQIRVRKPSESDSRKGILGIFQDQVRVVAPEIYINMQPFRVLKTLLLIQSFALN